MTQENAWRIAVFGAGAIGCRIAAHLAQAGTVVTLVDTWADHVSAIQANGLVLEQGGNTVTLPLPALRLEQLQDERFEVILLATRSDATLSMLPSVEKHLAADGFVVSCQNGLNEDAIAQALGAQNTLGCSLVFGAKLSAPGRVVVLPGPDTLCLGELTGSDTPRLQRLAQLFSACGTTTVTPNLLGYRWAKLVLNSIGNPLLLLSGETAAQLHARENVRRVMMALTQEILRTAQASGATPEPILGLPPATWCSHTAEAIDAMHQALTQHGHNLGPRRLSMVADFEARGRTEIDHINGYVVNKANSLGIPTPLNREVWRLVKQFEAGELSPTPENLQTLITLANA